MRIGGQLLSAVLLLCVPAVAPALQPGKAFHDYVRDRWSTQDGLPQVSAMAIAQDRAGYLWIGTQAGLARFDGVRFVRYTPENSPGLPGTSVQALWLARDGRLWVGTYKGTAVHGAQGFERVPVDGAPDLASAAVNGIVEDARGRVWLATERGVLVSALPRAAPAGRENGRPAAGPPRLRAVPEAPRSATALLALEDGVWIADRDGIHRPDGDRWTLERLPADAEATASRQAGTPVTAPVIHRLLRAQGRLWAATSAGLYARDDDGWSRFRGAAPLAGATPVDPAAPIDLLYADRHDNLWAGGDFGLLRIRGGRLVEVVAADANGAIESLRTAFEDREGSLWIGTRTAGVLRVRDSWTRRFTLTEGLGARIVWALAPDPDGRSTWVGGDDGISVLVDGRFTRVVAPTALPHPQPYTLLSEPGRLWIGTRAGMAVVEHAGPRAGRVQQLPWMERLAAVQVSGIVRTADGALWVASSDGVLRVQGGEVRHYGRRDGLTDLRARYLLPTRDGRLLVGTQGGLFERRGERFVPVGSGPGGLPAGIDITSVAQLGDGRLVVGSLSEVTWLSDAADGRRWRALDARSGLPANPPFFLVERGGYLWLAGIRGIARVPVADLALWSSGQRAQVRGEMLLNERGDSRSGQQGVCCNGAGNGKGFLRDGALWLPTRDGVVALDMASVVPNPVVPNVLVEQMEAGGQWLPASAARGRRLPVDARDVAFEYTVLSFQDPKSVGLEYRLRGYDRDWRRGNPAYRSVRYTNLPPGAYTFEVRGSNNAGVGAATASLAFSITPRFHETRWFIALVAAAVGLLLYGVYRVQRYRYRRRHLQLEELVQQRTAALEAANQSLLEASVTDPLTGLRNRRYVARQIVADLAHYQRRAAQGGYDGEVIACAMLDIDHFKRVNDQHGHAAGDRVLVQVAGLLDTLVRRADYVVRWGGEEFLLVFRPMPASEVAQLGERLCRTVATQVFALGDGVEQRVTCSVGISQYPLLPDAPPGGVRWQQLVEVADRALYRVKTGGRDGWASLAVAPGHPPRVLLDALRGQADRGLADGALQWIGSRPREDGDCGSAPVDTPAG